MISFSEIAASERLNFSKLLKNDSRYWAHIREVDGVKEHETLTNHSNLVMKYALKICHVHGIESTVERLAEKMAHRFNPNHIELCVSFIKRIFLTTIYFHDAGKINKNFQQKKMNNSEAIGKKYETIGSDHALLSTVIFIGEMSRCIMCDYQNLNENKSNRIILFFADIIKRHHQSLRNCSNPIIEETSFEELLQSFIYFEGLENMKISASEYLENESKIKKVFRDNKDENNELFILCKLCFSVLTAADYQATNEYMLGIKIHDWGVINEDLRNRIIEGVTSTDASFRSHHPVTAMNKVRFEIADEAVNTLSKNIDKNLFYLEAPTGSGKTHVSLRLIAELLKKRQDLKNVYYVFPFTTLVTQTFSVINASLNLYEDESAEIHSKSAFTAKKITENEVQEKNEIDNTYGNQRMSYIDALFVHFPICLTTHVRFFSAFNSHDKEANYLLHRLSNSVVIIDEIQSYPTELWTVLSYIMKVYSKLFNIVFIVMSATLPKIGSIFSSQDDLGDNFIPLLADKHHYFKNEVFQNRVKFDYSLNQKNIPLDSLIIAMKERIVLYVKESMNVGFKVMVEFMTKKSAKNFYDLVQKIVQEDEYFQGTTISLLSGTIVEPRRREIIDQIKHSKPEDKLILVCTQVVEAGVDIDMDLAFKDVSLIDSEEQCAGRVNRNALKNHSIVYLFNTGESQHIYKGNYQKQRFTTIELMNILQEREFDIVYGKIIEEIRRVDDNEISGSKYKTFKESVKNLNYPEVEKVTRLIDENNIRVFVPLTISSRHFSQSELSLLGLETSDSVKGEFVWALYESAIKGEYKSFIDRSSQLKELSSIMSKFTFSISVKNMPQKLAPYTNGGNENYLTYGYLYLYHYTKDNLYSYEDGLVTNIEEYSNFF